MKRVPTHTITVAGYDIRVYEAGDRIDISIDRRLFPVRVDKTAFMAREFSVSAALAVSA